jgi:hydroxymethylglutaryl-CoA lyase
VFSTLAKAFPVVELGAHLHTTPSTALEKIEAAFLAGCKRFDGALKGLGGCPMAKDELTGNLATETILGFLESKQAIQGINREAFAKAMLIADEIFPKH